MAILAVVLFCAGFCALIGFLLHMKYTRHKLSVQKDKEQIAIYKQLLLKLDRI